MSNDRPAVGPFSLSVIVALGCVVLAVVFGMFAVQGVSVGNAKVRRLETERKLVLAKLNLRMTAIALCAYEKENGCLPPSAVWHNGRATLSWRVLILPYLENEGLAEKGLFKQFKLDEPWDSDHNRSLLHKMPDVFRDPRMRSSTNGFVTRYTVFVGKGAAFDGPQGVRLNNLEKRLEDVLLVVEAASEVPWTKPEDLRYSLDEPIPVLTNAPDQSVIAAFADGKVWTLRSLPPTTVRALATAKTGGDAIPFILQEP